eukprot:jgi/Pico_ML_1/51848/g358.t2
MPNLLSDSTMCLVPERLCNSSACNDLVTRSSLAFDVSALLAATRSAPPCCPVSAMSIAFESHFGPW